MTTDARHHRMRRLWRRYANLCGLLMPIVFLLAATIHNDTYIGYSPGKPRKALRTQLLFVWQAPWPTTDELQSWEVIERHTSFCFGLINGHPNS